MRNINRNINIVSISFWALVVIVTIIAITMSLIFPRILPRISAQSSVPTLSQSVAVDGNFPESCSGVYVTGYGRIVDEPETKDSAQIVVVEPGNIYAEKITAEGTSDGARCSSALEKARLEKRDGHITYDIGYIRIRTRLFPQFSFNNYVKFSGKLSLPFNFTGETGREFNYRGYLSKNNIFVEIRGGEVENLDAGQSVAPPEESGTTQHLDLMRAQLFSLKKKFVESINNALGEPHAALATGLVVGEKAALGKELLDDFRTVGLIHIIVLSGFNITIIGDALRRVLSFLPRTLGIIAGGVGIILFGLMVGGGATVVRSCFMASIALFADLIRRDYSVVRALILAGCIMIIIEPETLIYDPSFQLSFLATLGLILLASPIESRFSFVTEKFGLRGIIASTLATQIFVSPFLLHMMGEISIIGMIVNILVLPFVPITMLVVFITGSLGMISHIISIPFGWIAYALLEYELWIVGVFSNIPYAKVSIPPFSFWWVVLFYVIFFSVRGIIYLLYWRQFYKRQKRNPS